MGKQSKGLAHQYSWQSVAEQYLELYQQIGQESAHEPHN
jgi:hypothetical protein